MTFGFAKLLTWVDSHWGVVQLQTSSRLPGWHSRADWSHKDGENKTWILSLIFLHILSHIIWHIYVSLQFKLISFQATHWLMAAELQPMNWSSARRLFNNWIEAPRVRLFNQMIADAILILVTSTFQPNCTYFVLQLEQTGCMCKNCFLFVISNWTVYFVGFFFSYPSK